MSRQTRAPFGKAATTIAEPVEKAGYSRLDPVGFAVAGRFGPCARVSSSQRGAGEASWRQLWVERLREPSVSYRLWTWTCPRLADGLPRALSGNERASRCQVRSLPLLSI